MVDRGGQPRELSVEGHQFDRCGGEEIFRSRRSARGETLQRLVDEGVDTLEVVAWTFREMGIPCYASYRMNGDYSSAGQGETLAHTLNSNFWWQHETPLFATAAYGGAIPALPFMRSTASW